MKQAKYLAVTCSLLFLVAGMQAQVRSSSLQVGMNAEGLWSLTAKGPIKTGLGQGLQVWMQYPISKRDALQLTLGYRRLTGYRQKAVNFEERTFPTEYQRVMHIQQLAGLAYWDAGLIWQHSFQRSPWSMGVGGRISSLANVWGNDQRLIWTVDQDLRITENSLGGGTDFAPRTENEKLREAGVQAYDFGLQLQFQYLISPGLRLQAGYYQGLQNVFSENFFAAEKRHYLSSFSLGFSARLF